MKRCYAVAMMMVLALAGAASAKAQDVSQIDKDRALQYLESTKKGVLDAKTASLCYLAANLAAGNTH